jgi:hypothetical protein
MRLNKLEAFFSHNFFKKGGPGDVEILSGPVRHVKLTVKNPSKECWRILSNKYSQILRARECKVPDLVNKCYPSKKLTLGNPAKKGKPGRERLHFYLI